MKNFDWTQFTRNIDIEAPIQTIYNAWSIGNEVERWFLSDATFLDQNNLKTSKDQAIEKGYKYQWQWYLYDKIETGEITDSNGENYLQFTFAGNCLVTIQLKEFDKGTIVTLSQKDIPTDDDSKQNIRLGCDNGWSFYLVNLKSVYEGGLDLRNKNQDLKAMLTN